MKAHQITLAVAALTGVTLLTSCSASTSFATAHVARGSVEKTVADELATQRDQPVPTVTCPGDLEAKVGAILTCTLVPKGAAVEYKVRVVVNSIRNKVVHYSAVVGTTSSPVSTGG